MTRPEIDARNQAMAERYRNGGGSYAAIGREFGLSNTRARQVIQRVEWRRWISGEPHAFELTGYGARVRAFQRRRFDVQ